MNIFTIDSTPATAAQYHCDKHVCKMIIEAAQMLSTTHRMLDGFQATEARTLKSGKVKVHKTWKHFDASLDSSLYQATHVNHPSNVWTRQTRANYKWHYELFLALCDEYTHRYGKVHATDIKLRSLLGQFPAKLQDGPLTTFPLAMKSNPECMDVNDPIASYRKFYHTKQARFKMVWSKREVPFWFTHK